MKPKTAALIIKGPRAERSLLSRMFARNGRRRGIDPAAHLMLQMCCCSFHILTVHTSHEAHHIPQAPEWPGNALKYVYTGRRSAPPGARNHRDRYIMIYGAAACGGYTSALRWRRGCSEGAGDGGAAEGDDAAERVILAAHGLLGAVKKKRQVRHASQAYCVVDESHQAAPLPVPMTCEQTVSAWTERAAGGAAHGDGGAGDADEGGDGPDGDAKQALEGVGGGGVRGLHAVAALQRASGALAGLRSRGGGGGGGRKASEREGGDGELGEHRVANERRGRITTAVCGSDGTVRWVWARFYVGRASWRCDSRLARSRREGEQNRLRGVD